MRTLKSIESSASFVSNAISKKMNALGGGKDDRKSSLAPARGSIDGVTSKGLPI